MVEICDHLNYSEGKKCLRIIHNFCVKHKRKTTVKCDTLAKVEALYYCSTGQLTKQIFAKDTMLHMQLRQIICISISSASSFVIMKPDENGKED